jgi:hypothetical protein
MLTEYCTSETSSSAQASKPEPSQSAQTRVTARFIGVPAPPPERKRWTILQQPPGVDDSAARELSRRQARTGSSRPPPPAWWPSRGYPLALRELPSLLTPSQLALWSRGTDSLPIDSVRKMGHLMRRRHGGRRARVRGKTKVAADFALLVAAVNLARLAALAVASTPGRGWVSATGEPAGAPEPLTPQRKRPPQRHGSRTRDRHLSAVSHDSTHLTATPPSSAAAGSGAVLQTAVRHHPPRACRESQPFMCLPLTSSFQRTHRH